MPAFNTIGFIGVGVMGEPICRHLATKSGIRVIANDRNTEPLQRLAGLGVTSATIEEIAQQADLIFMSLPSGEIVRNVVEGNGGNGLLQLCRSGQRSEEGRVGKECGRR